jgi:hypothetical protein
MPVAGWLLHMVAGPMRLAMHICSRTSTHQLRALYGPCTPVGGCHATYLDTRLRWAPYHLRYAARLRPTQLQASGFEGAFKIWGMLIALSLQPRTVGPTAHTVSVCRIKGSWRAHVGWPVAPRSLGALALRGLRSLVIFCEQYTAPCTLTTTALAGRPGHGLLHG